MIDAREMEKYLELRPGLKAQDWKPKVRYDGSSVILRVSDIRTFGGIIRLYNDANGQLVHTGASSNPMRVHDPFRLSESGAYILQTHLSMKDLPEGVFARIEPTETLAWAGVIFAQSMFRTGVRPLDVNAYTLRRFEIDRGVPIALLSFYEDGAATTEKELSRGKGSHRKSD